MRYTIKKIKHVIGDIGVSGDKSISHRAVMLGSIGEGMTEIRGFSTAEDCKSTVECIRACGGIIDILNDNRVLVYGKGLKGLVRPSTMLNAGNSGTTMRLFSGILCAQDFSSVITGDRSLMNRPMDRIIKPLSMMGADIQGSDDGRYAPLYIKGGGLTGIDYTMPVASAQVKSALLLASLYAEGITVITEPCPSRNHTEIMLKRFGADVLVDGTKITSSASLVIEHQNIVIPGDISAAAYFIVAASIIPGSRLIIRNVGINPTRDGIIKVIEAMGGCIEISNMHEYGGEPAADISVRYSSLTGTQIDGVMIPALIDEIPAVCVAAAFANGTTVIRDAQELKYKESNRINSMVSNLKRLGADVEETDDGIIIHGRGGGLHGNFINSFNDHRIVMAMAVAGAAMDDGVVIDDISSVGISFPEFFKTIEGLSS